jgi:tetratricopeptide (TPR) repeat protein
LLGYYDTGQLHVREARTPFVAAWLLHRNRSFEEAIDVVAPVDLQLGGPISPYAVGPGATHGFLSSYPVVVDPMRHEQAAERLLALAKEAEAAAAVPKPAGVKTAEPKQRPIDDYYHAREAILAARKAPAAAMRRAAWLFFVEAASVRAALRQPEAAVGDIRRALELDSSADTQVFAASILLSTGDYDGAKKHIAAVAEGKPDAPSVAIALILDTFIAAREARWEDAHATATRAHTAAPQNLKSPTSWLLAATALKVGRPGEGPGVATPQGYEREPTTWEKLAALPEAERRDIRLRMFSFDPPSAGVLVLPAVFYVLGEAANGTDPEAWIDASIPHYLEAYHSAVALRARAEASRWRGNEEAAKKLESRAASLEALADTPQKLILAKLAGVL